MRYLLVMRHAKSDWGDASLNDFDRPLNNRGKTAAPVVGKELLKRGKTPDHIISSPALRAKTTAELVSKVIELDKPIQLEKEFYFGYIGEIIDIVKKTDSSIHCLMVVGHNPTLEDLIEELLVDNKHLGMPTAAVVSLKFNINDWRDLSKGSANLDFQIIPKEL